jgi:hypothetical protein
MVKESSVGPEASPGAWMSFKGVPENIYDGFWKKTFSFALKVKKTLMWIRIEIRIGWIRIQQLSGPGSGFSKIPGSGPDVVNPDSNHRFLY